MPTSSSDLIAADAADAAESAEAPRAGTRLIPAGLQRIAGRLLGSLVVLVGAATAAFLAQVLVPGDRATAIYNARAGNVSQRTPEELAQITEQFGLDRPLIVQYLDYLGGLLRGDLGLSYQQFRPVSQVIVEQIGPTLTLTLTAIALSWLIMLAWVVLTAGRSRAVRALGAAADTAAAALPHYWLGAILLLVFAVGLQIFPVVSGTTLAGLWLPALTLAIPLAGFMGQATRTAYEQALAQPFVLSARTRGMGDTRVRLQHVIRHAAIPAVTLSGWALGATISGAVIVESVFNRPGLGKTLVAAVNTQDLPVVAGTVVVIAALYVLANLIVDAVYLLIDPRLRRS